VFKHKELVDAMLDRIKHHCTVINIKGPSLRNPEAIIDSSSKSKKITKKHAAINPKKPNN
jgi:hypothetical protein